MRMYILVNKIPVLEPDIIKWGENQAEIKNRRVAETVIGEIRISTVFLGLDHNVFQDGPPMLFETMIFGGKWGGDNEYQERCSTWEEAEVMHQEAVDLVNRELGE